MRPEDNCRRMRRMRSDARRSASARLHTLTRRHQRALPRDAPLPEVFDIHGALDDIAPGRWDVSAGRWRWRDPLYYQKTYTSDEADNLIYLGLEPVYGIDEWDY